MAGKKKSPSIETNRRSRKKRDAEAKRAQFFFKKRTAAEKFVGMQKLTPGKSTSKTGRASQGG